MKTLNPPLRQLYGFRFVLQSKGYDSVITTLADLVFSHLLSPIPMLSPEGPASHFLVFPAVFHSPSSNYLFQTEPINTLTSSVHFPISPLSSILCQQIVAGEIKVGSQMINTFLTPTTAVDFCLDSDMQSHQTNTNTTHLLVSCFFVVQIVHWKFTRVFDILPSLYLSFIQQLTIPVVHSHTTNILTSWSSNKTRFLISTRKCRIIGSHDTVSDPSETKFSYRFFVQLI